MIRCFVGYDPRQPVAYNVLQHSIHRHAKGRVTVEPLMLDKLPIKRRGLTEFTYTRYLVPYLCGYEGAAVFMDADIVVTGDIAELFAQADPRYAVQVMQEQPRFEWPSVMLFNNSLCDALTPQWIDSAESKPAELDWGEVGTLPPRWNHLVGTADPAIAANLYHYTQGLPCWEETRGRPEDDHWFEAYQQMNHTVGWRELMGGSVHAEPVIRRYMERKFGISARPK